MHARIAAVALAMALLPGYAAARVLEAGTLELSGGTELSLSRTELEPEGAADVEIRTFAVDTAVQYYLVRNFGLGLLLDHESTETEVAGVTTDASTTLIGPLATLNFSIAPSASLILQGGIARAVMEIEDVDLDGFALLVGGGLRLFPVRSVSLDATLRFTTGKVEDDLDNEVEFSDVALGLGVSIYFGGGR